MNEKQRQTCRRQISELNERIASKLQLVGHLVHPQTKELMQGEIEHLQAQLRVWEGMLQDDEG